ncbi:MAG: sensor histidine kinase [Actinobacteria bacterium]|nr:sensor histidine kinase [Actinomycetota bacterium]
MTAALENPAPVKGGARSEGSSGVRRRSAWETGPVRRSMSLSTQLLVLQIAIVLVIVVGTGAVAALLAAQSNRDAYRDRMIAIAQSVAGLPTVVETLLARDPEHQIQPIAEAVRKSSGLSYVVVTDDQGIRFSHPNPARIGEKVSTDPSIALSGKVQVETQTGTLGESWRVKVPIHGPREDVIGVVSVGIFETDLQAQFVDDLPGLIVAPLAAAVIGVLGSVLLGWLLRRRIYGLESEEIRTMLDTREAMLHGIQEGFIAVDADGRLVVVNDAAARLLDVRSAEIIGEDAARVLDEELARFLLSGETSETPVLSGERVLVVHGAAVLVKGRNVGHIAMLRDRTELEETLRDLRGARSLADDLRAQSHEFSNTLQVLSGLLETEQTDAALSFIHRVGGGGALPTDQLLHGIDDIEVSALVLAKSARAQELGIDLAVAPESHLREVEQDDDLLTIVGNLLDNAIEAVGSAGGRILLGIRDDVAPGRITVVVDDDGPGIPAPLRDAVFDIDVSDKERVPGKERRGIGLTIVKRVAQRLGGTATAGASAWGGARFVVDVPWPPDSEASR